MGRSDLVSGVRRVWNIATQGLHIRYQVSQGSVNSHYTWLNMLNLVYERLTRGIGVYLPTAASGAGRRPFQRHDQSTESNDWYAFLLGRAVERRPRGFCHIMVVLLQSKLRQHFRSNRYSRARGNANATPGVMHPDTRNSSPRRDHRSPQVRGRESE
jgi:hypothetical protein